MRGLDIAKKLYYQAEALRLRILLLFLFCVIFILASGSLCVRADTGPKPSVQITFENMGDEVCYGTLLSRDASTGPASAWDGNELHIYNYDLEYDIWKAFVEYEDADGYYFLQEGWLCSETKQLNWTYYPPASFKILLYYPESGVYAVSGIYERYAFDSYYTVDMQGACPGSSEAGWTLLTARRSYDYTWELISLACRIIITILLETGAALLFGFRHKKVLAVIAGINIVTQVVLNVLLNVINYNMGSLAFTLYYVLLEIVVFVIEAAAYGILLNRVSEKRFSARRVVLYALAANVLSFAGGFLTAKWIPGIF